MEDSSLLFLRPAQRRPVRYKWAALLAFLPGLVGAAAVGSTVTCGSTSVLSSGWYVQCSSGLDYATASGSLATFDDTVTLSASSYSSYEPAALQVGVAADINISDTLPSSGAEPPGYAEVVFANLSVVYNCHAAGGELSACPAATILAPVELGVPFTLIMDDVSSSPAGSFSAGISAQIAHSLRQADGLAVNGVREVSSAPEPTVWALMVVGLCIMGIRIRAQMKRL